MTGKQKMAQVVKHFEEILKLYPDNHVSLTVHGVTKKDVDRKVWDKLDRPKNNNYDTFARKPTPKIKTGFDITLFT